jgi:GAF domain-containing protein
MKNLNWLGFYILENDELILGPFQGKIACSNIKVGKGVCGKCASILKTINVKNVHEFEGHIACDAASNSELVVPIFKANSFYALIDIDSPKYERFSKEDESLIEEVSKLISKYFF